MSEFVAGGGRAIESASIELMVELPRTPYSRHSAAWIATPPMADAAFDSFKVSRTGI
jgi:hypothetical protein